MAEVIVFKSILRLVFRVAEMLLSPLYLAVALCIAVYVRITSPVKDASQARLVWGDAPIINNKYWSDAMCFGGWKSEIYTDGFASTINKRSDYGRILAEEYPRLHKKISRYFAFLECLRKYDVFFISFNGFFLGGTSLWRLEALLFKIAGKKVVVIPFGLDSYIYSRLMSPALLHGLMMSVPEPSRKQNAIAARVDYWCRHADIINPGIMGPDGFGRWDVLAPSSLCIDDRHWSHKKIYSENDGSNGPVRVVHSPNHRGFKGTEFVLEAVKNLQAEGLSIEFILIEKMQNSEVKMVLEQKADILVEQLVCTGHGLNALEGLASGNPVISNLENEEICLPFRRWSFLDECPIISSSPEQIKDTLRTLIKSPALRAELGRAGREYVEKFHGFDAMTFFWGTIVQKLYDKDVDLINIYHPLLSERLKGKKKIKHPLVKSKLVRD